MELRILALLSIFAATPALAVDFSTPLLGQNGTPPVECVQLSKDRTKCDKEADLTLGLLARFALDLPEPNLTLSDITKRGSLAEKIRNASGNVDLTLDEATLIRDLIVKFNYSVNIKYQAIRLVDPKGTEPPAANP